MENQEYTSQSGRPHDGVEDPRQAEPVAAPAYQSTAGPAAPRESRVTDPAVGTDGQLLEAGYGHGV